MESMDCSDQNTEPKMFGSTKKAYGDFCCVPGCSNQTEMYLVEKITGWIDLQYKIIITKYLNIAIAFPSNTSMHT
jgi:hypothetical protein